MKAIITVGLGFGDEGKGATVDFLTRELKADLVVRYCGGAQAGHNVELPDGLRHTFSQFGAGTLAGARTYLGPRMTISPTTLPPEAEHLQSLGVDDPWSLITVHPDCLVATHYHVLMNRLREQARGDARHGSCGMGIGETRHYWLQHGQDAVFARDLLDHQVLRAKLTLLRERFLLEMQELGHIDADLAATLHKALPLAEANLLQSTSDELAIVSRMPVCETVIFEGAQGVLLDEWYGFHPYTTWSTVTPLHALEMLEEYDCETTEILGITRAYTTRHGAGPFPTWSRAMSAKMVDQGNPHNDWQGGIRFGALDLMLLKYAAHITKVDGIFVNCLDELPAQPRLVAEYAELDQLPIPKTLREQEELTKILESATPIVQQATESEILDALSAVAPIVGAGRGPKCTDRELLRVVAGENLHRTFMVEPQMPIHIANRRSKPATLRKKFGDDIEVIDVTSKGDQPWVRFSPFYPHGNVPIPFSPDNVGQSVEGIWQGLKVFENSDIDPTKWNITSMKGIKRSVRTNGSVLGHRAGVTGDELLPYLEARIQIYLPAYRWVLENCLEDEVVELQRLVSERQVVLLDYNTNCEIEDLSKPLSHAALVKLYVEQEWPVV